MKKKLLYLFVGALVFRLVLAPLVWHIDLMNHLDWGKRFWEYGPTNFYFANVWNFTWPNQPPGTILIFALIYKLYEATFGVLWLLNTNISVFPSNIVTFAETNLYQIFVKLPAIFSDIGIAYLIYKIINHLKYRKAAFFGALLFLLNPVIWYNSAIWGQTDSTVNLFALLSVYLIFKDRLNLAILGFALALYIKISLAIFAPLLLIMLIKKYNIKQILIALVPAIIVILALTLIFSAGSDRNPISWLYYLYKDKVLSQQLQVITANAFNLWGLIAGFNWTSHLSLLGPLSYKWWSYLVFGGLYVPILYQAVKVKKDVDHLWLFALTAFSVFMLLTNMHERYVYPLFPYLTILVATNRKLLPLYIGYSFINLANLYNLWWTPMIPAVKVVLEWGGNIIPKALSFISLLIFLYLYLTGLRKLSTNKPSNV